MSRQVSINYQLSIPINGSLPMNESWFHISQWGWNRQAFSPPPTPNKRSPLLGFEGPVCGTRQGHGDPLICIRLGSCLQLQLFIANTTRLRTKVSYLMLLFFCLRSLSLITVGNLGHSSKGIDAAMECVAMLCARIGLGYCWVTFRM